MVSRTKNEQAKLVTFLKGLAAPRTLNEFAHYVSSGIGEVLPCESVSYVLINRLVPRFEYFINRLPAAFVGAEKIFERHIDDYPISRYRHQTLDPRAQRLSDFLGRRQLHRLALYQEFFRPLGIEYTISVALQCRPPLFTILELGRSRGDFSERDRALLNRLLPHLVQAFRNSRALTRLNVETPLDRAYSVASTQPVVAIGAETRRAVVTARAQELLTAYFDHDFRRNHLPGIVERWARRCLLTHATAWRVPPLGPLIIESRGSRLLIRFFTIDRTILLLLDEEWAEWEPSKLSSREREILVVVAQGKQNAEVAAALGLSVRTVAKHLEHVYLKLGVKGRAAAVARMFLHG